MRRNARTRTKTPLHKTADVSKRLGVSVETVRNWIRAGAPHKKRGRGYVFDLDQLNEWRAKNLVTGKNGRSSLEEKLALSIQDHDESSSSSDVPGELDKLTPQQKLDRLTRAKIRKEEALASKYEQQIAIQAGLYMHRDEVRDLVTGLFAMVKARLEAAPGAQADRWAAVTTSREMHDELREWVREIEADLSKGLGDYGRQP